MQPNTVLAVRHKHPTHISWSLDRWNNSRKRTQKQITQTCTHEQAGTCSTGVCVGQQLLTNECSYPHTLAHAGICSASDTKSFAAQDTHT